MLKATKIRLNVSEQDAATLEMMQGKCRGLYNWWVMKLRAGERWNWKRAKKTLAESRKFDPSIDQVYGKLQDASLLPAGPRHAGVLPPRPGRGDPWLPAGAPQASVLHPLLSSGLPAL